jgi:hypothetical protein
MSIISDIGSPRWSGKEELLKKSLSEDRESAETYSWNWRCSEELMSSKLCCVGAEISRLDVGAVRMKGDDKALEDSKASFGYALHRTEVSARRPIAGPFPFLS